MELSAVGLRRGTTNRRRRQRSILLVALAVTFIGSAGAWLAASGAFAPTISPPAGVPTTGSSAGEVASVDSSALSGSVTQASGAAQLNDGVPVTRVIVADSYESKLRLTVAWTNATSAGSFLNGKDQISIGAYDPVSLPTSGSCTSGALKVTDSNVTGGEICVKLDTGASGSYSFNPDTHTLLLTQQTIGGSIRPAATVTSQATCSTSPTTWCDPPGSVVDNTIGTPTGNQHVIYVLASILNPANHAPHGLQSYTGSLSFFVQAKRVG